MPYIDQERRTRVDAYGYPNNAGELNYVLTMIVADYVAKKGQSYQTFNDISGAMTEALAEFRRRVIVPYEEGKIKENGDLDVYLP